MSRQHHSHNHADHPPGHSHDSASPHPAQQPPWSMLRMTLWARLGLAVLLSAALWGTVWAALQ
jgi:hypothetical protein